MKIFLILVVSLVFSIDTDGQQDYDSGFTNRAEAKNQIVNGLKEGKWIEYYWGGQGETADTNAETYILSIYKEGKCNGISRWYYRKSRLLEAEISYTNGKKNGAAKVYYENGKVADEAFYLDDAINGIERTYYEN